MFAKNLHLLGQVEVFLEEEFLVGSFESTDVLLGKAASLQTYDIESPR